MDDAAALQVYQTILVITCNKIVLDSKRTAMNTNLLNDAKLMNTSAVGCAAQAASILKNKSNINLEKREFPFITGYLVFQRHVQAVKRPQK